MAKLMAHCGARVVSREELATIPAPAPMGPRHRPVPHIDVVNTLTRALHAKNIGIESEQFAVGGTTGKGRDIRPAAGDLTLFGVVDLKVNDCPALRDWTNSERGFSIGIRSNNAQKFAIRMIAGVNVFVCDNLAFAGEEDLLRKLHTTGLTDQSLLLAMIDALDRVVGSQAKLAHHIELMEQTTVRDVMARAIMHRLFEKGLLPLRMLKAVASTYFEPDPEWTDTTPRTLWGLQNAVTRVLRDEPLNRKLEMTRRVGGAFEAIVASHRDREV